MEIRDSVQSVGGDEIAEVIQLLRVALDEVLAKRHVLNITDAKLKIGPYTVEIAAATITFESEGKD